MAKRTQTVTSPHTKHTRRDATYATLQHTKHTTKLLLRACLIFSALSLRGRGHPPPQNKLRCKAARAPANGAWQKCCSETALSEAHYSGDTCIYVYVHSTYIFCSLLYLYFIYNMFIFHLYYDLYFFDD
jgi:hypothetical protein